MLDKLKEEFKGELVARQRKILEESRQRANQITVAKRSLIDKERRQIEEDVQKQLKQERGEAVSHAKVEVKRLVSTAKEDAVEEAMNQLWKKFTSLGSGDGKRYEKLLLALAELGLSEVGACSVIYASEKDKKFLEKKYKGSVNAKPGITGGLIVESKDGKIHADYTLQGIFEENKDYLARRIHEKMFGG